MAAYTDFLSLEIEEVQKGERQKLFNSLSEETRNLLNKHFDMNDYTNIIYFWITQKEDLEDLKEWENDLNQETINVYKRKQMVENAKFDLKLLDLEKSKNIKETNKKIDGLKDEKKDYEEVIKIYKKLGNINQIKTAQIEIKRINNEIEELEEKSGKFSSDKENHKQAIINTVTELRNCIYTTETIYDRSLKEDVEKEKQLTNFTMKVLNEISYDNNYYEYEVEFNLLHKKITGILQNDDFSSYKNFQKALTRINPKLTYEGGEKHFPIFKEFMFLNEAKQIKGLSHIGFIEKDIFIDSKCESSKYKIKDDILQLGIKMSMSENNEIDKKELKKIAKHLFGWSSQENAIPTVLFPIACMLNYNLSLIDEKLFHLIITGEAGAGKSTGIEKIIVPMLSLDEGAIIKATTTKFTLLKRLSCSNIAPAILDEYKPHKMNRNQLSIISEFLRSTYDRHTDYRGNQSMFLNAHKLINPIVLVGEAMPDETAIRDRAINLIFRKKDKECEFVRNSFGVIRENQEILKKLGTTLLHEVMKYSLEDLKSDLKKYLDEFKSILSDRQRSHMAKLTICFKLLEKVFSNLGLDIKEETNIDVNTIIYSLRSSQEDDGENRSIVENILDIYDKNYNAFQEDWHYKIVNKDKKSELLLDVKYTFDKIKKYYKEYDLDCEMITYQDFMKQLKHTDYFKEIKPVRLYIAYEGHTNEDGREQAKKLKKCVCLDLDLLKENLGFSNFG